MRAIVASGGGSKGPYCVGALRYLVGEEKNDYAILSGVSVGALITSFMAQYKSEDAIKMCEDLEQLFLNIENKHIWKHWFLVRRLAGLFKPAFLNSKPLQKLVRTHLDCERVRTSGKLLRIGAVSLTTGDYDVFTEQHPMIAEAVLASAAFPGFLLPIKLDNELYTDGGVREITPIKAAIQAGATEIDVIVMEPKVITLKFEKEPEALDILLRSIEIMANQLAWVDIAYTQKINELVRAGQAPGKREIKLRVISPEEELLSDSLNFDPKEAAVLYAKGYADAKKLSLRD